MTADLIERLREHATGLSVDRGLAREETDALDPPSQLETDLFAAAKQLELYRSTTSPSEAMQHELKATQRLLEYAVTTLQQYREWAKRMREAIGAFPGGEL